MLKYYALLFLCFLIGCKKEQPVAPLPKKNKMEYKREPKSIAFDSVVLVEKKNERLLHFYRTHGFGTVWNSPKIRKTIIEALSESVSEGLRAEDYKVPTFEKLESKVNALSDKQIIDYDILLTTSLQKYLWHLTKGKLNPKELYRDWDLKVNQLDINTLISNAMKGDSLAKAIESAKPDYIVYKRLKKALLLINSFPKDTLKPIEFVQKIVKNDTNNSVIAIKRRLLYWKDLEKADSLTNIYDKATVKAVKKFQFRHGLVPDGVIGQGTITALNQTKNIRREQIIANLERWKWYPKDLGKHYIIVNIPAYSLRIIKDGDTIERKRVVVGKEKRRTPILSSTFSNIVFNPTWTVPPTILKEDLVPAATANRGYFAARDITIYDSKGNVVSPEKWNPEKPRGYRYVQAPGNGNSLGNVKFNFPNHYTVYLHDTNHRDYFGKNYRSLSSGCVRVEDPLPLAAYMLDDEKNWSLEKINELIATKKTTSIGLKQKIKLHQLYWTASLNDLGTLDFRADIYNLDHDLYKKLGN